MIKETLKFTGYSIPVGELLFKLNKRKANLPVPGNWFRIVIEKTPADPAALDRLDSWINEHMSGRWSSYHDVGYSRMDGSPAVVYFESEDDAVLFKLMDGGAVWLEESLNIN